MWVRDLMDTARGITSRNTLQKKIVATTIVELSIDNF